MKKLTYSPSWDLSTVPFELLRDEYLARRREQGTLLGGPKLKKTRSAAVAARRAAQRESTRKWREKLKQEMPI
jgi:hypothetical protein